MRETATHFIALVQARRLQILLGVCGVALLVAGYQIWRFADAVLRPMDFESQHYRVEKGATLAGIARDLADKGIIRDALSLRVLAKLPGASDRVQAGNYVFSREITMRDFLRRITTGEGQATLKLTLLEGWTFKQMREHINAAKNLRHRTQGLSDAQLMEKLGQPGKNPEGLFYPDTYFYHEDESDFAIYRRAFEMMQQTLEKVWAERAPDIQLKDEYEALILASIIEKESSIKREEQAIVSGVFNNRLKLRMRLQSDPTVIYGMRDTFTGNLKRSHLRRDTEYNTYTRHGLPPTPICLPGLSALRAAVMPESTEYLYFVAKGDGAHQFSATLEEHNRAVYRYQRRRRK